MKALIDGDIIVYRCGFSAQHTYYDVFPKDGEEAGWLATFDYKKDAVVFVGDDESLVIKPRIEVEPVENALQSVKSTLNAILEQTGSTDASIYLTGKGNYREKIATIRTYKGNRDPNYKPRWYQEIRDYLLSVWGAEVIDGKEADDAIGTEAFNNDKAIICTIDKDLDMIPGWHYNFVTKEMYEIGEYEADRKFYMQLLTGDTVDNIEGVPGIGPKRAEKLLKDCDNAYEMYDVVLAAYDDDINRMEENAHLLWIQREDGVMWSPPYDLQLQKQVREDVLTPSES